MEGFLREKGGHLDLPPAEGQDTVFEFLVNAEGEWEHWNNRVCSALKFFCFQNCVR